MKRVRIMFINCPTLSTDAATYLLLAQNKVQRSIEFEVVHHWISATTDDLNLSSWEKAAKWLAERFPSWQWLDCWIRKGLDLRAAPYFANQLTHNGWFETVKKAVDDYDAWFQHSGYDKFDTVPLPTIVITETPIDRGYIGMSRGNLAVVSLAEWESFFKPGSAFEYILGSVQRYALRLLYLNVGSHYPTRGCIWDFDVHQPDSRVAAYMGVLCSTCHTNLSKVMSKQELTDAELLISNEWIGSNEAPTSVSASLRKVFGYSLRRSTGLHPGILESISQGMRSELGKFVLDVLKVMLAALGTLYIASKFPELYKAWIGK
jgi:hypothetical protein